MSEQKRAWYKIGRVAQQELATKRGRMAKAKGKDGGSGWCNGYSLPNQKRHAPIICLPLPTSAWGRTAYTTKAKRCPTLFQAAAGIDWERGIMKGVLEGVLWADIRHIFPLAPPISHPRSFAQFLAMAWLWATVALPQSGWQELLKKP